MTELALDTDLTPEQRKYLTLVKNDVVLMDVQMPMMDGFEATAAIREHKEARRTHLPITAMTAHAMQKDRERCLGAGMDDYVTIPMKAADLYAAIERIIQATPITHHPVLEPDNSFAPQSPSQLPHGSQSVTSPAAA
jgi:CheY-like chemotaxis protein